MIFFCAAWHGWEDCMQDLSVPPRARGEWVSEGGELLWKLSGAPMFDQLVAPLTRPDRQYIIIFITPPWILCLYTHSPLHGLCNIIITRHLIHSVPRGLQTQKLASLGFPINVIHKRMDMTVGFNYGKNYVLWWSILNILLWHCLSTVPNYSAVT